MTEKQIPINERYGRLRILGEAGKDSRGIRMVECLCDCGNVKAVRLRHLQSGLIRSCGCLQKESMSKFNQNTKTKHGGHGTKLYRKWTGIKTRCYNQQSPIYKYYGGRGISMCEEWRDSFAAFRDWALSNGYHDNLTIERNDVNGNYCPENCRWATEKEQANNKRNSRRITHNGETHTISEWAEITGINRITLDSRLSRGWPVAKALETTSKK